MNGIPVAIVEDNPDVLDDLIFNLSRRGFAPQGFQDGASFERALAVGPDWNVLILDLGLPGEDGLTIARRLQERRQRLGIVMLTARDGLTDRITGLNAGADIYLSKPVDMDELAASLHAVMRRIVGGIVPSTAWRLEVLRHRLINPDGRSIRLTPPELSILKLLASTANMPVDRDQLVAVIGKDPDEYDMRSLEVMMSRLRRKLGDDAPIRAVRQKGYVFADEIAVA